MKLSELGIPTSEVPMSNNNDSLTVRGLSAADLDLIIGEHGDCLQELFQEYTKKHGTKLPDMMEWVNLLRRDVPEVGAMAIALACDDYPAGVHIAVKLPIGIQANILTEIVRLTVTSVDSLKKTLAAVLMGMEKTADMLEEIGPRGGQVQKASTKSNGKSGKKSQRV